MYLLDTNIVSLVAPARRRGPGDDAVADWVVGHSEELYLSVVTAAEIVDGIERARRTGATAKAQRLSGWWEDVTHYWRERILPFDLRAAETAGRMLDRARAAGTEPGFEDVAIAATALTHELVVLTRNERHFQPLGVAVVNPYAALPS